MQLSHSLSTLLAGVLLMFTIQLVEAAPFVERQPSFVTLPLKRVQMARDVHPQIVRVHLFWYAMAQVILTLNIK